MQDVVDLRVRNWSDRRAVCHGGKSADCPAPAEDHPFEWKPWSSHPGRKKHPARAGCQIRTWLLRGAARSGVRQHHGATRHIVNRTDVVTPRANVMRVTY